MKGLLVAVVGMVGMLGSGRAQACAGCRNPSMPVSRLEAVHLAPGDIRAAALLGATSVHVVHPAGCADPLACSDVPVQPAYLHDQRIFPGELRAVVEAGLGVALGVEVQIPVRMIRTTITYTRPDGTPYEPVDPGVHHRNETVVGMGDPWLLSRGNTRIGGVSLTGRAGLSLPLGGIEPNPFALGAKGLRHQHIQFGTGTFDPVIGFEASRSVGTFQVAGYAQAQAALYENRHGYRAGLRGVGGAQAGRRLVGGLSGALSADLMHEGAERWDGRIAQDGNLGRTEILAGASLVYGFGATSVGLSARFPVWRRLVVGDEPPGTLSSPLMVNVVLSRTFVR